MRCIGQDASYGWMPSTERLLFNATRPRSWLSFLLTFGVPGALALGVLLDRKRFPLADVGPLLTGLASYGDLTPAVVMGVTATEASVLAAGVGEITLDLQAVRWARSQIDENTRGQSIKAVSEVLTVGDLIRVEYLGKLLPEAPSGETEALEEAVASEDPPAPIDTWRLAQLPEIQGALVSIDPKNGAVLALSGGFDFGMNQYNHALQAARQPGSGFKPFVYSAALDSGMVPAHNNSSTSDRCPRSLSRYLCEVKFPSLFSFFPLES